MITVNLDVIILLPLSDGEIVFFFERRGFLKGVFDYPEAQPDKEGDKSDGCRDDKLRRQSRKQERGDYAAPRNGAQTRNVRGGEHFSAAQRQQKGEQYRSTRCGDGKYQVRNDKYECVAQIKRRVCAG